MYQRKENGNIQLLPYDKFLQNGAESLSDEELLAIILRTGTKGEDAVTLACRVLDACGERRGIEGLHHVTTKRLMQISGIGEVKAVKLKAIAELSNRIAKAKVRPDVCFRHPGEVADAYMEQMRHLEKEHCMAVFTDSKDRRITDVKLSIGNLNTSIMSAREIFRQALMCNAASVILLHNHPSGDPTPSKEDIALTLRLKEASQIMEIPLLDHIIIGDNTYISLREKGVL
ncbi:MAG: JAB domain-containing protein [Lachnospiraceae bacterium]|nr:JAB domain-containing protein [Lachnospiraceae bacterium]